MSDPLHEALVRDLRRIVGDDAVITSADRLLSYESDGLTAYRAAPGGVILPGDTDEARRVLAALHRAGAPVVPRGAGTGLSGGALAGPEGVVVGTARMNRILRLDPANRRARAQSGTVNARLSDAARPHGLHYAPDPSSQSACTLGGNVAENSGGPHCLKYGVTSRYVAGLVLVLPDGEVVELRRDRAGEGLDLAGVVVGSEGCFGLVTEVEVELLPLPEGVRTVLAVFDEIEDAGRAVTDIIGRGLLPAALEIIDRETIRAVEASVYAAGYPVGAGAALVIEFDGLDAGLDDDVEAAETSCREAGAREIRRARDDAERAALWKGRKKAFGAMGRVAPDLMVQDATVPRTRLPGVLGRIGEIARRYDLTVANVFHAGDGNLHPNILFDRRNGDELERVERASREMMEACVEAGGTITGEHGVGIDKRKYMSLVHGADDLEAMADVKAVFDPAGRFNPGKVLPDGVGGSGERRPRKGPGDAPSDAAGSAGTASAPVRGSGSASGGPAKARPDPDGVAARLRERVGAEKVSWEGDGAPPVVRPVSTAEVASVMKLAHGAGWRVRIVGSGLLGPSPGGAGDADVVLRTTGLRAVSGYEPADLTLTAGAGVELHALAARTASEGQWLPLDPPGPGSATLGGVLATGLAGPLAGAYGRPRDLVLGLTCVTGDGRILRLGGRVVKNVAGFDLVKLLVGSRGRLGVIAEATVRLFPLPEEDRLLGAGAPGAEALVPALRSVAAASPLPATLELAEDAEGGRGARMAVRLLGSTASVVAHERILRERVAGLEPVEPDEAGALIHALRHVGCGRGADVRVSFPPEALASVLALVRRLEVRVREAGARAPSLAVDASLGVLRWCADTADAGGGNGRKDAAPGRVRDERGGMAAWPHRWAEPLDELRRGLAGTGASIHVRGLTDSFDPEGGARDSVVRRLEDGLVARFDPGGVLSGRSGGVAGAATGAGP